MRGFAVIALDNPKSEINVGSAMRAVGVYGAAMLAISGKRLGAGCTDTMKHHKHIPLLHADDIFDLIPHGCVPVAVDLVEGAMSIVDYIHPERAFYIFGAEDSTLGERVISRCRDIIYIPTSGCMNLAATVNVVLYDRMAKKLRTHHE